MASGGSNDIPLCTSVIFMTVTLRRRESITLLCLGARCWITTKAMLGFWGTWEKNPSRASSPPAEAPIPTMGKDASSVSTTARRGSASFFLMGLMTFFSGVLFFLSCMSTRLLIFKRLRALIQPKFPDGLFVERDQTAVPVALDTLRRLILECLVPVLRDDRKDTVF